MNAREKSIQRLAEHLPPDTASGVWDFIEHNKVQFRISKPRKSKLGDYRPPHGGKGHRISVNGDLNPYAFLITTLHEFAHLLNWNEYKNRKSPHGKEWKQAFRFILEPYVSSRIFPDDVTQALESYLVNPAASSCADVNLLKALKSYDTHQKILLEELPDSSTFKLSNGLIFEKGHRLRKRYKCYCLSNKRWYYVSGVAEVVPLKAQASLF